MAVVVARAGAAWGFEVAGSRAATNVLSQLRLDVVERRLRDRPAALDGARSADLATTAVGGVDALETAFARYLPQLVLALVVPVAVLALVASIDPVSAGVMLLTLPLVPVFMWLVGRHTERRTRERRQALAHLANHFLDVVRGLPTLRAFNRGGAQSERIAQVGDDYRRATMGTLRIAFLSGTVLELAATLGIALVAVTVGVRLVEGGLGFEAGLTVLVLAPELYLPLRNLAAQYHASADGLAVSERLLDLLEEPPAAGTGRALPPSPRDVPVRLEDVSFAYPGTGGRRARLGRPRARSRRDGRARRRERERQEHDRVPPPPPRRAHRRPPGGGSGRPGRRATRRPGGPSSPGCLSGRRSSGARSRRTSGSATRPPAIGRVRAAAALAGADEFVRELPDGYDTVVGDGGRPLSAGQLQRLALARAFLRDAPLVILDEPTANLDPESAELVGEAIERLREGRTVLLIAHRPELARRADRIVTLAAGRIVEPALEAA